MEKTVARPNQQSRTAAQILAELREPILSGLSRALRGSFASSVDELLERLLAERSWDVRQKIDDSLDLLRNGREGIEAKFDQACAEEWASRTGQRERRADQLVEARETRRTEPKLLSLVDDNQIGDQLTVGRIASRIRRRLDEEQVDGLRARFGLLLDRDWFSDNDFPIAPDVVLECLRKALSAFGPAPVVAFLLDQFEPKLSAELATLYQEVNELMINRGVMPEIRYHVAKPMGGGGFAGGGEGEEVTFGDDAGSLDAGASSAPSRPGGNFGGALAAGFAGAAPGMPEVMPAGMPGARPAGMPRGVAAGLPGGLPGGMAGAMPGARSYPPGSLPPGSGWDPAGDAGGGLAGAPAEGPAAPIMMTVPAVRGLIQQMARRDVQAQGSAARYLSDPTRFGVRHANLPTTSQPLIAALTVIQDYQPPEGRSVAEQGGKVREHLVEVAEEHGTPLERLIIETVSLVFDNVYEDPAIADTIKQQLLRLQVSAFKAALIDPSFFARPEHPMRRLIDRIAGMGSDPDFDSTTGSPLVTDVAELVTWILANFDRDLAIIEDALERLGAVVEAETDRRAERLAKIATAAARTERLERTRDEVRSELRAVIRRSTPEFIARFIADQWTEVISRLRNGADYAPFDEGRARSAVEKLVWSVAPKKAVEIRRLAADLPQLIADLSRGLSFVATSEAERELFFSELLAWHGAAIAEAKRLATLKEAHRRTEPMADVEVDDDADEDPFDSAPEVEVEAEAASARQARHGAGRSDGAVARTPAGRHDRRDRHDGPATVPMASDGSGDGRGRNNLTGAGVSVGAMPHAGSDGPDGGVDPHRRAAADADADADDGLADQGGVIDAVEALDLVNGTEIELISVKGEVKRFKLGWMSPARTVFIFSRYPKDHWTVRRPMLSQLLEQGRIRVVSRPAKTNQVIESLKAR